MLEWKECIQERSTLRGQVLVPQCPSTYLVEETKQTLESWSNICLFLNYLFEVITPKLIAYEVLRYQPPSKGLNLRNRDLKIEKWLRVVLDKKDFITTFIQELKKTNEVGNGLIRKLDLVVPKEFIFLQEKNISSSYFKIFNMFFNFRNSPYTNEEEYISISHDSFTTWNNDNTKLIRGNDNEYLQKLTSVTNISRSYVSLEF